MAVSDGGKFGNVPVYEQILGVTRFMQQVASYVDDRLDGAHLDYDSQGQLNVDDDALYAALVTQLDNGGLLDPVDVAALAGGYLQFVDGGELGDSGLAVDWGALAAQINSEEFAEARPEMFRGLHTWSVVGERQAASQAHTIHFRLNPVEILTDDGGPVWDYPITGTIWHLGGSLPVGDHTITVKVFDTVSETYLSTDTKTLSNAGWVGEEALNGGSGRLADDATVVELSVVSSNCDTNDTTPYHVWLVYEESGAVEHVRYQP